MEKSIHWLHSFILNNTDIVNKTARLIYTLEVIPPHLYCHIKHDVMHLFIGVTCEGALKPRGRNRSSMRGLPWLGTFPEECGLCFQRSPSLWSLQLYHQILSGVIAKAAKLMTQGCWPFTLGKSAICLTWGGTWKCTVAGGPLFSKSIFRAFLTIDTVRIKCQNSWNSDQQYLLPRLCLATTLTYNISLQKVLMLML